MANYVPRVSVEGSGPGGIRSGDQGAKLEMVSWIKTADAISHSPWTASRRAHITRGSTSFQSNHFRELCTRYKYKTGFTYLFLGERPENSGNLREHKVICRPFVFLSLYVLPCVVRLRSKLRTTPLESNKNKSIYISPKRPTTMTRMSPIRRLSVSKTLQFW